MMEELANNALEAERNGELAVAAKFYALYSFHKLVESNCQDEQQMRRGVTRMLESISADVRAENHEHAQIHFQMVEPLLQQVRERTNEKPITGLATEWLGDAHLMLGNDDAIEYYEQALETFQELEFNDRLFWGAEPEFDNAYGAMKDFLAVYDVQYPNEYTIEFEDRIRAKIDALDAKLD